MKKSINGIMPTMLTAFDANNQIDWGANERLIEWYIEHGANSLFAVCQSSEMQYLTLSERIELAKFTVKIANGRVPVVASGHISDDIDDQIIELNAMSKTGIDALIMVTNRLDINRDGESVFAANFIKIMSQLNTDIDLGFYECPAPYRRLLTDDEFNRCIDTGRFVTIKDVSCDLEQIKNRINLSKNSPMTVLNANAALAWPAICAGAPGFCGISNNYHPDLYAWLYKLAPRFKECTILERQLAEELSVFLSLSALTEAYGYPSFAKLYHQHLGTIKYITSRVNNFDLHERFWAIDAIIDSLITGNKNFRRKIMELDNIS